MAKGRDKEGKFTKGNNWWELRSKHGRDRLFANPEDMWEAACEYFKWCEENPLYEEKLFAYQGQITRDAEAKMRVFTIEGLCHYLGCNTAYFRNFKLSLPKDETDFNAVIKRIEETIRRQKFEGASSGFFNSNIIARDLGLSDKQEHTGKDGQPIEINIVKDEG